MTGRSPVHDRAWLKAVVLLLLAALVGCAFAGVAAAKRPRKVEIYGTSWCPNCRKAKEYFAKRNIPYTFYDIEKDKKAYARVKEYTASFGVPIVIIDGEVIEGYSPDSFEDYVR